MGKFRMKAWSLHTLFFVIVIGSAVGATALMSAGIYDNAHNEILRRKNTENEIKRRIADHEERWIADLLLQHGAEAKTEASELLPEFEVLNLSVASSATTNQSSKISGELMHIHVANDGDRQLPYALEMDVKEKQPAGISSFLIAAVLLAGSTLLLSSFCISFLFYRRFTAVIRALDESIVTPLDQEVIIPRDLGEFEELLKKAYRLRDGAREAEKSITMARIAAEVSHDIRSPISALNLALFNFEHPDQERIDLIRQSCKRINSIANELLEKSRGQLVQPKIGKFEFSMSLQALIREKSLEFADRCRLTVKLAEQPECIVEGNEAQLCRGVSNLLNNAADASREVTLRTSCLNGKIVLEIEDKGTGIDSKVLRSLSQGIMMSSKKSGNGLGILQAKRAVESMTGGKFRIRSRIGRGTCVTMEFANFAETN